MNIISKNEISSLGYNFIPREWLPKGKDEYHLRNLQNRSGIHYRKLNALEIEILVRNQNTSDDWNQLLVSDAFNPDLVRNCKFFGLVRIGKLEPFYLEFHNLRMPVGLYNSTIISCDLGDNVVIGNTNYLSHYIIGNEVMIVNVNELATTSTSKFGNGIIKQGESESVRIWLELCNENGGRKVIPFNGMLPGDAWIWSKYRDDETLLEKLKLFTEKKFDQLRGYYGKIGDRTVIKNCKILKDVWIGTDAYLKGANKIKNLTINSSAEATTQIGEGCELVNGIIGHGCRIFYGAKAVRFIMASHSQLKYGARLINSYLGDNSTISCCEVLNSLIFPSHEQHHNNSFLCASTLLGQSNIAAGATIGSNHNSRSPDGELLAGRGFWPGLCVSLKHNSRFAAFNILAKGDYPFELDIRFPFSLVSNDVSNDRLLIMPGYWFLHNLYALARNEWKYNQRDQRIEKIQLLEYNCLAPDSINEMVEALDLFHLYTGKAYLQKYGKDKKITDAACRKQGEKLLSAGDPVVDKLEIISEGAENSERKVVLLKVSACYALFIRIINYYATLQLVQLMQTKNISSVAAIKKLLRAKRTRNRWLNIGGQLIREEAFLKFRKDINAGRIKSWDEVHSFYQSQGASYAQDKFEHAMAVWEALNPELLAELNAEKLKELLADAVSFKEWLSKGIYDSRAKDYTNPFRKMVYDSTEEMNQVVGKFDDNAFIKLQQEELKNFKASLKKISSLLK